MPEAVSIAPEKVFDTVGMMNFDPRNQVVLSEEIEDRRQANDFSHKSVVKITDYGLHNVSIKAETNRDGNTVIE